MSTAVTMERTADGSPQLKARMAGVFWLLTILTGTVALVARGSRLALLVNLVSTACYVGATVFIYYVLEPVDRTLARLSMFFGLVGCGISATSAVVPIGAQAPTVAFIFFGVHCLLVGYLIIRSTFLPRAVGALMVFGGLGWLTFSLSTLLSPPLARALSPGVMVPGILGEVTLTLWLLVFGVNAERWKQLAGAAEAETA